MPVALSYPGVYIEENTTPGSAIVGVSTSLTAFIGRALRGPVNQPTLVESFADFTRQFGGLWAASALGYSVAQFFANGGSQALIVRVHNGVISATSATATLTNGGSGITLQGALDEQLLHEGADVEPDLRPQRLGVGLKHDPLGALEQALLDVACKAADRHVFPGRGERIRAGHGARAPHDVADLAGTSPAQAYFVQCDSTTTTPTDAANGIVNIIVGFAPLYPAEFVVIQIQQISPLASS